MDKMIYSFGVIMNELFDKQTNEDDWNEIQEGLIYLRNIILLFGIKF